MLAGEAGIWDNVIVKRNMISAWSASLSPSSPCLLN